MLSYTLSNEPISAHDFKQGEVWLNTAYSYSILIADTKMQQQYQPIVSISRIDFRHTIIHSIDIIKMEQTLEDIKLEMMRS